MTEHRIRVSCASLCRFQVDDQYALILNQNRRSKGLYQLTPLGGALEIDDWDALGDLDITLEKLNSRDLRFFLNREDIPRFREWFYKREERETTPFRELREELVEESNALYELSPDDLSIRFVQIIEDTRQTERSGQTGYFTHYFFEIHDVRVTSNDVRLRMKNLPRSSGVVLVSEEEARQENFITIHIDGQPQQARIMAQYLFA